MHPLVRWLSWFPLWFCAAGLAMAQDGDKLTVQAHFAPATAKPGERVTLVLQATVDPDYHAYGTKEPNNIPVALDPAKVQAKGLAAVGKAKVPPGSKKEVFGIATYPLPHEFEVTQEFTVAADARGELVVRGELDYQVCDENSCLPPGVAAFTAKLTVDGAAGPAGAGAAAGPGSGSQAGGAQGAGAQPAGSGAAPAGQEPAPGLKPGLQLLTDAKLRLTATVQPSPARPGEAVRLTLHAVVDPKYHAYGTKETINKPVQLDPQKLQLGGLETLGAAEVPPGELTEAWGVETFPLPHEFEVVQWLRVPMGAAVGEVAVSGELNYQVCDENMCLPQATARFRVVLPVEAGAPRQTERPAAASAGGAAPPANGAAASPAPQSFGGLWGLIVSCILGGLFALVMPCTYPMIPITFSFFTKQADRRGGKVLTLALLYGGGIVGMFTLIGALASVLGQYIVSFAAHWGTNLVIGGAFLLFGLSLLGLFTLQLPASLRQAAGQSRNVGGAVGVLLMGATLVVSSFTCTAPVVGLLLLPAVQSGDAYQPALGMAVFGLTMALPFVGLALLPGRVKALPRSGEWMNTLKVTLGFVELAAALKFFSNAEYVVGLSLLPREVFFGVWVLLFVALAGYLLGLFPRTATSGLRKVSGLGSLAFAGYCAYGALGFPLDFVMTALAPAYSLRSHEAGVAVDEEAKHWRATDDYAAALAYAKQNGKLVLVNLTGFTCTNCRMVERGILPDPSIAPLLREHFVEARLHMDYPDRIPAEKWAVHSQLRERLVGGRQTTPTYVTVDPNGERKLQEHVLSGGPTAWLAGYQAFLDASLKAAGRRKEG